MSDRREAPGSMRGFLAPLGMTARVLGMTVPFGITAMAVLALSACRSPAAKAEEARTKLKSWDATIELLERERASGAVPEQFAAQVRRAANRDRRKAEAQLRKTGGP
jgi:hypothetical protein